MPIYLWVGLGGFIGALARYGLGSWAASHWGTSFPLGTLLVNGLGSFLLAFFLTLATGRLSVPAGARPFMAIGFLGGFTTFSSFSYETVRLMEQNGWGDALLNLVANVGLGLAGAILGIVLAQWIQKGG
jgi:CrcB protein